MNINRGLNHQHPKYSILFSLGIDTGLRISDILRIQVKTISKGHSFSVTEQKTKKDRIVSVRPVTKNKINRFIKAFGLKPDDYLIFSRETKKDKPLGRVQAYKIIARISRQNGLCDVGTHSMRKTYATNKIKQGATIDELQKDFKHIRQDATLAYVLPKDEYNKIFPKDDIQKRIDEALKILKKDH
jgi:integrase